MTEEPSSRRDRLRRIALASCVAALASVCLAPLASAQSGPATTDWTRVTTLSLFGGIAVDSVRTGGAAGGAFGWAVTPRLAIEGTGTWFDRGVEADGFSADIAALVNLRPPGPLVPYVKAGAGFYHTSFDIELSRVPDFYRARLVPGVFGRRATFSDPTLVLGSGVHAWLSESVSVRPEVDVKMAVSDGRAHPVATAGIRIAYHFEKQPRSSRTR